jgi:hypothetical protein
MSDRIASSGVNAAAAAWVLRDRQAVREGTVKVQFRRQSPLGKLEVIYQVEAGKALLQSTGRRQELTCEGGKDRAGDAAAWRCDCPAAEWVCLHAALAARGLADAVEAAPAEDEAVDPSYASPQPLQASSGLLAALATSTLPLEKEETGLHVGEAHVKRGEKGLECDCPQADQPACLHRLIADAWARGQRTSRPQAGAAGAVVARSSSVAAIAEDKPRAGEKLDAVDVTRFEVVLGRADLLVTELLTYGLQRLSAGSIERVDSLIMAARSLGVRDAAPHHAGLGRLVRALEGLRTELVNFLARKVTTTELDVLRWLGVVRNIGRAVRANTGALPLFEFAGATQQEYEPVAVMDIQGLGFEAWVTATGYAGATSYVADLRTGRLYTRTNSLPAELAAEQASRSWRSDWADGLAAEPAFGGKSTSVSSLSKHRYLLSGAMVAPDTGRLSGSSKTQLAERPSLALDDPKLRALHLLGKVDAVRLTKRLGHDPLGRAPLLPMALVPVAGFTPTRFDPLNQELSFEVQAPTFTLPVRARYSDARARYIDNLEKLVRADPPPKMLFCRLVLEEGGLHLEPITAHFEKSPPQHLTYKPLDVPLKALPRPIAGGPS